MASHGAGPVRSGNIRLNPTASNTGAATTMARWRSRSTIALPRHCMSTNGSASVRTLSGSGRCWSGTGSRSTTDDEKRSMKRSPSHLVLRRIYFDADLATLLKHLAAKAGVDESEVVRQAIARYAAQAGALTRDANAWRRQHRRIQASIARGQLPGARSWPRDDLYSRRISREYEDASSDEGVHLPMVIAFSESRDPTEARDLCASPTVRRGTSRSPPDCRAPLLGEQRVPSGCRMDPVG